jgi:hypothetical protein
MRVEHALLHYDLSRFSTVKTAHLFYTQICHAPVEWTGGKHPTPGLLRIVHSARRHSPRACSGRSQNFSIFTLTPYLSYLFRASSSSYDQTNLALQVILLYNESNKLWQAKAIMLV